MVVSRSRVVSREPPTAAAPDDATGGPLEASINKPTARVNQNKARTCGARSFPARIKWADWDWELGCGRRCDMCSELDRIWWICHPHLGT